MRDDGLYFQDIVDASNAIMSFVAGVSREEFESSDLLRSAVLQKLLIIGEAAAHVCAETKERHSGVEWRDVVSFRNFAIHAYFAVDWGRVWDAATIDAPALALQVEQILADEFPEEF